MPQIPFALQWSITENELLPLKDSIDGYLFSTSALNIPGFIYYLEINPNGNDNKDIGKTVMCLNLNFKDVQEVEANFTYTIESANYSKKDHYIYEKSCGWPNVICKTNELFDPEKRFIVDGKFTVKVSGIFKFENTIPAATEQKWIGGELGDQLWKKEGTKDFAIITSDGNESKAHKVVLDCRSDVFSAKFNSNMKEAIENKVFIPDFSFKVVETGIKLIYHCNFTTKLSMDELMQLQQFFDKYDISSLMAKIESLLIAQISASTVVLLTNASIQTNSLKLKEKKKKKNRKGGVRAHF